MSLSIARRASTSTSSTALTLTLGDFTITRASSAYVLDYNSVWLPLDANEPGFKGARRVKNYYPDSDNPDNWDANNTLSDGTAGATYGPVMDTDANGNARLSYRVQLASAFGGQYFYETHGLGTSAAGNLMPGTIWSLRYETKLVSGSQTWDIYQRNWDGQSPSEYGNGNYTPTASWQVLTQAFQQDALYPGFGVTVKTIATGANESRVAKLQFEDLTGDKEGWCSSEYVPSTDSYGVQWFATKKGPTRTLSNLTDTLAHLKTQKSVTPNIAGVLTEGTGAAVTPVGLYVEPAGTNYCDAYSVPSIVGWGKGSGAGDINTVPFGSGRNTAHWECASMQRLVDTTGAITLAGTTCADTANRFLTAGFRAGENVWFWRSNNSGNGDVSGPFTISIAAAGLLTFTGSVTAHAADAAVTTRIMRCPNVADNITMELNDGTWFSTTITSVTLPAYNSGWTGFAKFQIVVGLTATPPSDGGYASADEGRMAYYYTRGTVFGGTVHAGSGSPTIKLVNDQANLIASGLGYASPTGLVYALNAGTAAASFYVGSNALTLIWDTTYSVYAKRLTTTGTSGMGFEGDTSAVAIPYNADGTYSRVSFQAPGGCQNTPQPMRIDVSANKTVYLILPQIEQYPANYGAGTALVSSPMLTTSALGARSATVISKAWGTSKNNNISGSITWTPASGALIQKQSLWSLYASASNYAELSITGSTVTFRKRSIGVNYDVTASLTPVAGTANTFVFAFDNVNGVTLSVNGVAATPNTDTRALSLTSAALLQVGATNSLLQAFGCFSNLTVA